MLYNFGDGDGGGHRPPVRHDAFLKDVHRCGNRFSTCFLVPRYVHARHIFLFSHTMCHYRVDSIDLCSLSLRPSIGARLSRVRGSVESSGCETVKRNDANAKD